MSSFANVIVIIFYIIKVPVCLSGCWNVAYTVLNNFESLKPMNFDERKGSFNLKRCHLYLRGV